MDNGIDGRWTDRLIATSQVEVERDESLKSQGDSSSPLYIDHGVAGDNVAQYGPARPGVAPCGATGLTSHPSMSVWSHLLTLLVYL